MKKMLKPKTSYIGQLLTQPHVCFSLLKTMNYPYGRRIFLWLNQDHSLWVCKFRNQYKDSTVRIESFTELFSTIFRHISNPGSLLWFSKTLGTMNIPRRLLHCRDLHSNPSWTLATPHGGDVQRSLSYPVPQTIRRSSASNFGVHSPIKCTKTTALSLDFWSIKSRNSGGCTCPGMAFWGLWVAPFLLQNARQTSWSLLFWPVRLQKPCFSD